MKKRIKDEVIFQDRELMVEENPWNNRITLKLNDEPLKRIEKKTFVYTQDGMEKKIVYGGNKLKGTYITIDDKTIPVFPKQPPYVWPLAILPFLLILILSNIPALGKAGFPLIGGLIGGGISGGLSCLSLYVMSMNEKHIWKIFIGLAFIALTILICLLLGLAIVSIFTIIEN